MTPLIPDSVKRADAVKTGENGRISRPRRASSHRRSRGVALIEFAVVLPFLLILFFFIIDFGLYFLDQHTLQFATREGARVGLTGRQTLDANGQPMSREASIVSTIQYYASIAPTMSKNLSISIYPINATFTDPAGWNGSQNAGGPGDIMRVRVQYNYQFITPFLAQIMNNGGLVIQAEATYKNETF
jgi:Flp pilus assembly protein TadG